MMSKRFKRVSTGVIIIGIFIAIYMVYVHYNNTHSTFNQQYINDVLDEVIVSQNEAVKNNDIGLLMELYEYSDNGQTLIATQKNKIKFMNMWAKKQGVKFNDIKSDVLLKEIIQKDDKVTIKYDSCTKFYYSYLDQEEQEDCMRIGSINSITVSSYKNRYNIIDEESSVQFSQVSKIENMDTIRNYINSMKIKSYSDLQVERLDAVDYVNRYCSLGYSVNNNSVYKESIKLMKDAITKENIELKTTNDFLEQLLKNGKIRIVAKGRYHEVYKEAYDLQPADIIVYHCGSEEAYLAMITGCDSKGYPVVSGCNTYQYRVAWDIGCTSDDIIYTLLHVDY